MSRSTEILCYTRLPARLSVPQVAAILGFAEHDIPILVTHRLLAPLGQPAQNAAKYFALADIQVLSCNTKWLHKATLAVTTHWQRKNQHRRHNGIRQQSTT